MAYSYYVNVFGTINKVKKHKTIEQAKKYAEEMNYRIEKYNVFSLGKYKFSMKYPKQDEDYI